MVAIMFHLSIYTWSFGTQLTHFQNDERFQWTSKSPLGIVQIKSEEDMNGDAVVVLHPSANWIKEKRTYAGLHVRVNLKWRIYTKR
jgi:hypothetical protein